MPLLSVIVRFCPFWDTVRAETSVPVLVPPLGAIGLSGASAAEFSSSPGAGRVEHRAAAVLAGGDDGLALDDRVAERGHDVAGRRNRLEGELDGAYIITVNATRDTSSDDPDDPDDGPYENEYNNVKAAETFQTWKTQGHYVNKVIEANEGTFYIAQDKFWKATTETTIPAHRATFTGEWYYPENQGAPSFSIMLADHNGETTTISALDVDREDAAPQYYDASGRRQSELQPGLNIVRKADGTVVKVMRK